MSWYKFFVSHGPGHCSYSEKYEWFGEGCENTEFLEQEWDWWVTHMFFDNPIGGTDKVAQLPNSAIDELRNQYEFDLAKAQRMLDILNLQCK